MLVASRAVFERAETIKSWDDSYYHPIAERLYDRMIPDMLKLMDARPGSTILDAGCGPGVHSIRAAKRGYHVVAIDISEAMLGEARRRAAAADLLDMITLRQADLTNLDFGENLFDFAFSWGVIIHIREVEKALDHLARIVRPGGRLAVYVSNNAAVDKTLERLARFALRKPAVGRSHFPLGTGTEYTMHGEKLWVWQFDIPELVRQVSSRGFKIVCHRAGEFSEIQRRAPSLARAPLLLANDAYYRLRLPATLATGNLLVFRKALSC